MNLFTFLIYILFFYKILKKSMKTQIKNKNNTIRFNTDQSTFYTQENKIIPSQNYKANILNKTYNGFNQNQKKSYDQNNYIYNQNKKLFSLLDINDKITNSRGTCLPIQYKRLTDEEIKKKFEVTYTQGWNYDQNIVEKAKENTKKLKEDYIKCKLNKFIKNTEEDNIKKITTPKNNTLRSNSETNIKKINNNKQPQILKIKKLDVNNYSIPNSLNNNIEKSNYNNNNNNKIKNLVINIDNKYENKKPKKSQSTLEIRSKKDSYLPKGYSEYEFLVKNPKVLKRQVSTNNPNKFPFLNIKEIKEKSYASDIFFRNPSNEEEQFTKKLLTYDDHQNSDIFLQKNDIKSIFKNGECYLFKPKKQVVYNSSRESNSQWMPKPNVPTLLNHVSTEYNLLNPSAKAFSNTKNKIIIDCYNKRNPNIEAVNNFNPIYRQKVFCEFNDLTRNGAPNFSKEYLNSYNSSQNCFSRRSDLCSNFYDIHSSYRDICTKPFIKDKIV